MACMNEVQQGQISSMAELTQLSLEELVNIHYVPSRNVQLMN